VSEPHKKVLTEGIEIWLGDCRDVLPIIRCADIAITSPPYNTLPTSAKASGLHAERRSGVNKWLEKAAIGYSDHMNEDDYQLWLNEIITTCSQIVKGIVWVNHKVRYRDGIAIHPARMFGLPIYSEIIWNRGGSMALNCRRFAPSHETILGFGSPHYWDDSNNSMMSVWQISAAAREADNSHPCPYPVSLISPLIEASCPSGGVVLDPFMGSGTTGVAAALSGRCFVGIEKDIRWFDLASRRISGALAQPRLAFDEPVKPKQESLAL